MAPTKDAAKKVASDFEKIIKDGRARKKNEALAAKIFSTDRRSSTPGSNGNAPKAAALGGSLASRAGVKKQPPKGPRHSTGNINGEWTHDLHTQPPKGPKAMNNGNTSSLAARITNPNAPPKHAPTGPRAKRAAQIAHGLEKTGLGQTQPPQGPKPKAQKSQKLQNIPTGPSANKNTFNKGLTIRGLAGPYVVMAQNFAPGTTAADIESAMTPVGGIITSCRVLKQTPLVVAEIIFESKEGADNVVATFDKQTADGKVISVYHKVPNVPAPRNNIQNSRSGSWEQDDGVVDGSWGFDEPMQVDSNGSLSGGNGKPPPTGPSLYSDSLVTKTNRWGRGFGGGSRR
ncbi:hypothetical protein QBC40DRAFT_184163 [Triangularia verruculosa]|uniref:RRM domain-containing protein n=1 Tax=Triangularia verruculosa TaxID=2587418 RepID=A0AAN6X8L8_9PEZI|nr:hypothetical protein QBC40DRAFT_184163 [Triangularia verruculosa]